MPCLSGCGGGSTEQANSSAGKRPVHTSKDHARGGPFAGSRVWTTPLPADAPVDARSDDLIRTLVSSVEEQIAKGTGPALSARARTPVYVAGPNVPRVPVELDTGPWADQLKRELAKGVPIPPDAKPSTGRTG